MLPIPTQGAGALTAKETLEVVKTVFGELGAGVHPKTDLEAEAIASTIFNRADDINSARADAKAAKKADEEARKDRETKLRAFDDIQRHRAAYVKKLGSAAAYDVEFKARQAQFSAANAKRAQTWKAFETARDLAIERNSWLVPAKRDNDLTATALDVIEPPLQYEGTAAGKKLYADFPSMSDQDRERNLKRWNAAMKAVAKVAGTARAKRMNFVNMHQEAHIRKGGRPDAPKARVVYGQNAFW